MESFISEDNQGSSNGSASVSDVNKVKNENNAPTALPFFKKVLPWCAIGVFATIAVVFTRLATPLTFFTGDLELVNVTRFIQLAFSLVWFIMFFAVLRKIPFYVGGIIFVVFFFPAMFSLYLRSVYGVEIDYRFIVDCLNTNWEETRMYLSIHSISVLLGFVAAMFATAWFLRKTPANLPRSKIFTAFLVFLLAFSANQANLRSWISPVKITLYTVNSLRRYYTVDKVAFDLFAKLEDEPQEFSRIPSEISNVKSVPIVVLHIGETARADHSPFNGYHRNTMPNMFREYEAGNLVSFPKCVSFAVYTEFSMRGILSPSTVLDNAFRHPSLIPVLNQSGVKTCGFLSKNIVNHSDGCWINQLVRNMKETISTREPARFLLPEIRETVASETKKRPEQELFFLYYGEGSHTPFINYDYGRHAVFKPNGMRKYKDERDVNNYDNTFIAVDEFCAAFIDTLRDKNAVYIFVGDHGEMLGEDGLQGRPFQRKEVRHVLFFVWASEKFKTENPELWTALLHNRERLGVISHDFVYNSVLHLFGLKTPFYDDKADLFSDSAEPFPTEMPSAEEFGPTRFSKNEEKTNVGNGSILTLF